MTSHLVIGVAPHEEKAKRARIFAALEAILPVQFEARDSGALSGTDAAILFGTEPPGSESPFPTLVLQATDSEERSGHVRDVVLSSAARVLGPLRGLRIGERSLAPTPIAAAAGADVLATSDGEAVWTISSGGHLHAANAALTEIGSRESLRTALQPGRFLGLLAVHHFLRGLTGPRAWALPPLRAAFVIDDPNLHWSSYGYVRFPELARHARRSGYHVAMAMVPLDTWFAHRKTAELFRENPDVLSLLVHGNNHVKLELAQLTSEMDARRLVAQALRRIEAFERRARVPVARVMVPPHGRCGSAAMSALATIGFDAACFSGGPGHADTSALAGWEISDVGAGTPVMPRRPFAARGADLALEAYLGRPLILYGHHEDLAAGPTILADAAAAIDRFGDVRWCSVGDIAETNFLQQRADAVLSVRPFSRRIRLDIPAGVERVAIDASALEGEADARIVVVDVDRGTPPRVRPDTAEGSSVGAGVKVEVRVARADIGRQDWDSHSIWHPWPVVRRVLTEARDRVKPLLQPGGDA